MKMSIPMTLHQAHERLMRYCDKAERCQQDALRLALKWGFGMDEAQGLVAQLITEGFISEQRYASAFAHDKFAFYQWGARKIEQGLKRKGITERNIRDALKNIPKEDEADTIVALIKKKEPQFRGLQLYQKKVKLMRYLLSKGFASDDIGPHVERYLNG